MFPSQKCAMEVFAHEFWDASMGPGCFHPRNSGPLQSWPPTRRLQWGRDVSIPEIPPAMEGSFVRGVLQWGRDVSIPEIRQITDATGRITRLQWGRDVSIPEMRPSLQIVTTEYLCFNGAGMFPSQKWEMLNERLCFMDGFNGAGMFPSQK